MSNHVKFSIVIPRALVEQAIKGTNITYDEAVKILRDGKVVTDPRSR